MKNMLRIIIILPILFFHNLFLKGQDTNYNSLYNYSIVQNFQAPSVSTFNTYGKIPISLYTGTPNISIPLYTIEEQGLSIPIELRYNINNVKPNTHPGIVGLGWNLFAGGSITRIQRGASYDEKGQKGNPAFSNRSYLNNESALSDTWRLNSYYGDMPVPVNEPWYGEQRLYEEVRKNPDSSITTNFLMYRPKTQPDKYTFNFSGYNGSFYRDHTGWWVVESETPFEVEHQIITINNTRVQISDTYKKVYGYYASDGNNFTIEKFILTAPDGVKFEFGGINAIDYSVGLLRQSDKSNIPIATTWHLSKITMPNNNTIEFDYTIANPIIEGSLNFWIQSNYHLEVYGRGLYFQLVLPVLLKSIKSGSSGKLVELEYQTSTELKYRDIYFKEGWSGNAIIDLSWLLVVANTEEEVPIYTNRLTENNESKEIKNYQLSKIKLPDGIDYIFSYSNSISERLKLLSLSKKNSKEITTDKYSFEYNNTKLPDYISGHYDHLGFFNGKDFSYIFKSDFYFHSTSPNKFTEQKANADKFYNSREGDRTGQYVCAEMLQKIQYPTGGYSIFEYEPNYVNRIVSPNRQSVTNSTLNYPGGLRIKKIKNYSHDNAFIDSKAYYYVSNFNKITKSGTPSGILGYTPQYYWDITFCQISPKDTRYNQYIHNENLKILTSGSTNQAYFNLEESAYVGYSEVIECSEDLVGNIQGYTKYKYSNFGEGNYDGLPLASFNDISGTGIALSPHTPFSSNSKKRGQLIEKEIWNNNGQLKQGVYNKYINIPITDRMGTIRDEIRNIIIYIIADEYGRVSPLYTYKLGGSYIHQPYTYLLSESTTKTVEGSDIIQQTTFYEYNQERNIIKEKIAHNDSEYTEIRTKYTGDLFREGSAWKSPIYSGMDMKVMDNYPLEKIVIKNGNVISADITNYKRLYGDNYYPSEKYKLKTNIPIVLNQYQSVKIEGDSLKADPRCEKYLTINSYYNNPVPDYIEDKSSKTVYLWAYNERYPIAKIENASYQQVATAMGYRDIYQMTFRIMQEPTIEDWNKINSLRQLLPDSHTTTYKYKPFVGITEITDPSGNTTTYEYDTFNRLEFIKDRDLRKIQENKYNYKNQ